MKKHLLLSAFVLFTLQLSAQLSLSIVKGKWYDSYFRYDNKGRDSELVHHTTGIETGYRNDWLVVNFQSSLLYFNRDITHKIQYIMVVDQACIVVSFTPIKQPWNTHI